MILCDMLAGMDYRCLSGNVDVDVTDLIYDSRIFIALLIFLYPHIYSNSFFLYVVTLYL